jgi:hypothetical protein
MFLSPAEIFRFRVEWLVNVQTSVMFFRSLYFNFAGIMSAVSPLVEMPSIMTSERINAQARLGAPSDGAVIQSVTATRKKAEQIKAEREASLNGWRNP